LAAILAVDVAGYSRLASFPGSVTFHPKGCETSETEMATWLETMFRRPVED
jgi:hypothetical protein